MKIICIGKNYADKNTATDKSSEPIIFTKTDSAILPKCLPFYIPNFSEAINYEVELVVKIDKIGKNVSKQFAHRYYSSVGIGIDFTAIDLLEKLKSEGLPWEKAKAFDNSAVIGNRFIPLEKLNKDAINFKLYINGETRQIGNSADMIFNIDELIEHISKYFMLKIGDLIFTGTPAGVATVKPNDRLEGFLENEKLIDINVK